MEGVRVLEVAQFTFVPAAGAIPADWGADVIKVEHPVRAVTPSAVSSTWAASNSTPDRHPLMEHPNRGKKRSVGIDVSTPEGQEVLYEIARSADVFLTNYLPPRGRRTSSTSSTSARRTPTSSTPAAGAYGDKGVPSGTSAASTAPRSGRVVASAGLSPPRRWVAHRPRAFHFGDSIGGMNIAYGISAAPVPSGAHR